MQGKVEICGVNTAKLKTLSQAEMDMLLLQAKAGSKIAQEKLIEGNLRLVLSVIQRFVDSFHRQLQFFGYFGDGWLSAQPQKQSFLTLQHPVGHISYRP